MSPLVVHELPPSPNGTKVRIALGYKGIPYESRMYDSHAIIRFLGLNLDGPRLLPTDADALLERTLAYGGLMQKFQAATAG